MKSGIKKGLNSYPTVQFPSDFVWGAATSSFQIEGAVAKDGRIPSIWDQFCTQPGAISDGTDGEVACDHYLRMTDDVELMSKLNLQAYRFSIAWPRIVSTTAKHNDQGLDFYDRLVDQLLARNIRPYVTLYHWDLPQWIQEKGGWVNRDTVSYFTDFTSAVVKRLGDRVSDWITHNEPWCAAILGYAKGEHAPGLKSWNDALIASHHILLSHGLSMPIIRELSPGCEAGIALNMSPVHANREINYDQSQARIIDGEMNRWFGDPVFLGSYPEDMVEHYDKLDYFGTEQPMSFVKPGDMEAISTPTDFLGINYYSRILAADESKAEPQKRQPSNVTDMGWEVYPKGIYEITNYAKKRWGVDKIYITENGAAYPDEPNGDQQVHDSRRVSYFQSHIESLGNACRDSIPIAGYFAWSLMDNFEWAFGYSKRFGIVWVDYETQQRIPKDSALWYRDMIAQFLEEQGGSK